MSNGNDRLVSQGVQTYIGFEYLKYLGIEMLLVSVFASFVFHAKFHWNYIAGGLGTLLVLGVVMVFRKLAVIFSFIMSTVWGVIAGIIALAFESAQRAGSTSHHSVSWVAVVLVGLFVFLFSMGAHMYAIGSLRTATQPLKE